MILRARGGEERVVSKNELEHKTKQYDEGMWVETDDEE
jgi:hypothetical protein